MHRLGRMIEVVCCIIRKSKTQFTNAQHKTPDMGVVCFKIAITKKKKKTEKQYV